MEIKTLKVNEINPAVYNPRKDLQPGDPEYEKLKKSITEFDMVEPLVWNKQTGNLVGGHQRLKILKVMGIEEVEVSVVDLNEAREKALNLALNKISGEWDMAKLKDLLEELDTGEFDMEITGFDFKEIEQLMTQYHKPGEGLTPEDEIPEAPEDICQPGDIWQLGNHRIMCGDATLPADVDILTEKKKMAMVFTDPPYGVSYRGTNNPNGRPWEVIEGDELRGADLQEMLEGAFKNMADAMEDKAAAYIMYASKNHIEFETAILKAGLQVRQQLIWYKHMVLGHSHYHWAHEPILYCSKEQRPEWYGDHTAKTVILNSTKSELTKMSKAELLDICMRIRSQSTVIEAKKDPVNEYLHPTQKPVALMMKAIANSSPLGGNVLDLFTGSGPTLIACERLDRRFYGSEIAPKYCDITIKRWENYTGEKAVKVE